MIDLFNNFREAWEIRRECGRRAISSYRSQKQIEVASTVATFLHHDVYRLAPEVASESDGRKVTERRFLSFA